MRVRLDLSEDELCVVLVALDELGARRPDIVPLGDPDGTHQRGELARALVARLRLAGAAPSVARTPNLDRERAVREVFRLAVDILVDVADERQLTRTEHTVLHALSPDLARRVQHRLDPDDLAVIKRLAETAHCIVDGCSSVRCLRGHGPACSLHCADCKD